MKGGDYGNPFRVSTYARDKAIELFEIHTLPNFTPLQLEKVRQAKEIGCFCAADERCHTDSLVAAVNLI